MGGDEAVYKKAEEAGVSRIETGGDTFEAPLSEKMYELTLSK